MTSQQDKIILHLERVCGHIFTSFLSKLNQFFVLAFVFRYSLIAVLDRLPRR